MSVKKPDANGIHHNQLAPVKFAMVGFLNTGIDYGVFILLSTAGLAALIAHTFAYTTGLVNSFIWNRFWTFRVRHSFSPAETLRFVIVNLAALLASGGILLLGMEVLDFPEIFAKAVALPFSLTINYLGNRLWVFPRSVIQVEEKDI